MSGWDRSPALSAAASSETGPASCPSALGSAAGPATTARALLLWVFLQQLQQHHNMYGRATAAEQHQLNNIDVETSLRVQSFCNIHINVG